MAIRGHGLSRPALGPAALEVLGDGPDIDLPVTDIVMAEGMSGFDLAEATRKLFPDIKTMYM